MEDPQKRAGKAQQIDALDAPIVAPVIFPLASILKMKTEGYIIVLKPGPLLEKYARLYVEYPGPLRELRDAFSMFDVGRYRGISRNSLLPYPSLEQKVIDDFEATGIDMKSNAEARKRFCAILGDRSDDSEDYEDFLPSLRDAREVLNLTDDPSIWELIHLSRGDARGVGTLLGFDVGIWGGDYFSLIADTIVIPRWHPPIPDDFTDLASALSCLNENLLFNSPADAAEFKKFYMSKPWAETEPPDGFWVVRVSTPDKANQRINTDQ